MILYNWKKILNETNGSVKDVMVILDILTHRIPPSNYYDPKFKFWTKKWGGRSYLLNPEALFMGEDTDIDLVFRIGKDENYYEVSQDIYKEWDDRNEIDINIENLNQLKIPLQDNPGELLNDVGLDGCSNEYEDGLGSCVDTLSFKIWCSKVDSLLNIENFVQDQISNSVPVNPIIQ